MRAAIYARVSTSNHGQDVSMQTRELQEYCERRGFEIAGEYTDVGISGSKDSRPELNRLMTDAKQRRFDAVCVWKLDRFGRSLRHLVNALWVEGNDKEVWKNLRPAAVRKKLGTPKFDPMYSFLSEHGSHGTFRGLQARSLRLDRHGDEGKKTFKIWVGGSPMVHHIVWTNSLCIYTALQLLVKCVGIFAEYLNADEIEKVLETSGEIIGHFFREHYVGWAKDAGLKYETVLEFLDKEPWKKP
jgi:hypothetical protein